MIVIYCIKIIKIPSLKYLDMVRNFIYSMDESKYLSWCTYIGYGLVNLKSIYF